MLTAKNAYYLPILVFLRFFQLGARTDRQTDAALSSLAHLSWVSCMFS